MLWQNPYLLQKCYLLCIYPITRQTYPDAQVQNCSDRNNKFFQFNMEDENSWFTITPTLEHKKRPAVFGPKDVTPVSRRAFGGAGDAGIYASTQLSVFWDNILISAASGKALQKFSRESIVPNTAIHGPEQYSYYGPRTDFYVDNMISPSYFKIQFMDTFGSVAYVLECCGIYFFCFLFIKLIADLIVMILRHMEFNRFTGAWIWQDTPERFLQSVFDVYSNISIQSPRSSFASVGTWTNAHKNRRRD